MPTYTFKCPQCGLVRDEITSISHYTSPAFEPPQCHGPMERFFTAGDPMRALDLLTSDAIYEGLKATDGTDISTRAKHREYMRKNNLTTVDDFTQTWARAAREHEARMAGEDKSRVHDVVDAVRKLGG
jgi:putative FmdB family regulatory protein